MNGNSDSLENFGSIGEADAYQVMPKPVGPACNMACTYCYYTQKTGERESSGNTMSERLLEQFIRQFLLSQEGDCICVTWHGGEPLLRGLEFFKKAVELQRKYAGGRKVENSIQTNGLLIDEDWCRFFHENRFLVGLSIDGPQHVHDRYRRDRNEHATFSRVIRAMRFFQKHKVEFNTLSTINDYSSRYPVEIYRFFKEQGVRFMQFIPVSPTQTLIREIAYVHPDTRREMRAARYLNWRINRQVNVEDKALIERVQAGMASSSYSVGPLSENEVCLRSFARRMRRMIPECRKPTR